MRLLIHCFILTFALPLIGQEFEPTSINLTVLDGLASNNVYCAMQDDLGYIWFGTETGVSRYNGREFENFYMSDGLPDNEIFRIDQDSQGRIWFSVFNAELSYYKDGKFYRQSDLELPDVRLSSFYVNFFEDSMQTIWLNTRHEVLAIRASGDYEYFDSAGLGGKGINGFKEQNGVVYGMQNSGNAMIQLSDQGQIFSTLEVDSIENRANLFDSFVKGRKAFLTQNGNATAKEYLKSYYGFDAGSFKISKFHSYAPESLWVCTYDGVYELWPKQKKANHFLKKKISTHVLKDREGGTWFTTLGSGVYYVPSVTNKSLLVGKAESSGNYVSALFKSDKKIWFGGANGVVGSMTEDSVLMSETFVNELSRTMVKDFELGKGKDELFVAAEDHLLYLNGIDKLKSIPAGIKTIRKVDDDNYVLGLSSGFLYCSYETIRKFLENGNTSGAIASIVKIDPSVSLFRNTGFTIDVEPVMGGFFYATSLGVGFVDSELQIQKPDDHEVFDQRVNDILVLNDSTYAFATHGLGVFLYRKGQWQHFDKNGGLASDICKKIIAHNDSTYWVATNNGVSRISMGSDARIENLTKADGLLSEEVYDLEIFKGDLVAATSEGISIISISDWQTKKAEPTITRPILWVGDDLIEKEFPTIQHDAQSIRFTFDGLHFKSLGRVSYEYRLIGQNDAWQTSRFNSVNFGNLPAGDYKFQVRAVNAFEGRSTIAEVPFSVNLPFWKSWWGICLLAVLFIVLVLLMAYRIIRHNRRKSQRQLEFKLRLADAERKALQSQLNPHFIFNSLNSIQSMVLEKEPEEAYRYLEKFSKLIRRVLQFSDLSMIPIGDELETLKLYMDLEKVRLEDSFEYSIIIDDSVGSEELIPAMVIQPYVENAIWHGVMPLNGIRHGVISIEVIKRNNELRITVSDNGVGRSVEKPIEGYGSKLAEQLAKTHLSLGDSSVKIEDIDLRGQLAGTRVIIKFLTNELIYD